MHEVTRLGGEPLSIKISAAVWDLRVGSSTDKLVLLALAEHANDAGRCWPSIATLMTRTELGRRTVLDSLERLKAGGHIEVIHRHRHSNLFKVRQPHPTPSLGAAAAPPPVRQMPLMGAAAAPRTVKDPSKRILERSKSVSAEDQELDQRARDLCFRVRMTGESAKEYRECLDRFEAENPDNTARLKLDAAQRRIFADF